jgi:ribose transport system substrate-binding protein
MFAVPVRKAAMVLIPLAVVTGAFAAVGSSASSASKLRLAVVLPNTSDPFFMTQVCAAKKEGKRLGVTVRTFTSTSTDTNAIANNFQSALLTKPQGIFVSPFNNNQFIAQYKSLMKKGVPVATGNTTTPATQYKWVYSAADTARFAPTVLKSVPSGSGKMVYLGGAPGIPPLEARTLPFVKAVEKARPDLDRLPDDYSGFDINKETQNVSSLLLAHPDLKLIIAADGPDAAGAAAAITQAGKAGKVTLVAFDAIPPEVQALKQGVISYLIAQSPATIGRLAVNTLVSYLKKHPNAGPVKPAGRIAVPNQLLTKATVDSPRNAAYIYKTGC